MIWTHGMAHLFIEVDKHGKRRLYDAQDRWTLEDYGIIAETCKHYGWAKVPDHLITRILDELYPFHWPYGNLPRWGWPMVRHEEVWRVLQKHRERCTPEIMEAIRQLPYIGYSYHADRRCYIDLREVVKLLLPKAKPPRCIRCNHVITEKRQVRELTWLDRRFSEGRISWKYMKRLNHYPRKLMCGPFCAEMARKQILALHQLVRKLESRQRIHERKIEKWKSLKQTLIAV